MATYRKADQEVLDIIQEPIAAHHPDLLEAGVRVGCRMAYAATNEDGSPKGPALKCHGYPAAAVVKIVSHKDRVAGMPDAMIDVDGKAWSDDWSEKRQRAVLDHELTHLEVQRDDQGAVKFDDCFRPKLKMRLHSWELGGFDSIAQRYKEEAIEVEAARQMADKFGNLLFPW